MNNGGDTKTNQLRNTSLILHPAPFIFGHKKSSSKLIDELLKKTGGDLLSRFRSTIGARGLNFCVRNGNRWAPLLKPP